MPIAHLEALHRIAPERVDWVFEQTQTEGEFRRAETRRVNTLVFAERLLSMFSGLAIGLAALGIAGYLALHGSQWVAGVIGGTTVVGLVTVFVVGNRARNTAADPP